MTVTLLPSAEATMVGWAKAQPSLTALCGGRVGTQLSSTLPAIRVQRVGNPPPQEWQDDAALQVECWAATQISADLLMRTFIAALPDIRGYTTASGRVWSYAIGAGPYYAPDEPPSTLARYIATVDLVTTP